MNACEIEKRFNEEYDLYAIYEIRYNEENGRFFLEIYIDFKEELYNSKNSKFYNELERMFGIYFNLLCTRADEFPVLRFTMIDDKICYSYPSNEIEKDLIDYTKKFLSKVLHDWGVLKPKNVNQEWI